MGYLLTLKLKKMKKQFRFDASQKEKVAQSLELLKNDTLSVLSAELISGGAGPEWVKATPTEWVKAADQ
jgi:hypothetical protein